MIQRLWRSWRERLRRIVDGMSPNDEEVLAPDGTLPDGEPVRPSSAWPLGQANTPAQTPQFDAGLARQIKSRLRLGVLQRVSQALPVRVTRADLITCYRAPTVMQNVPTGPLPMVKPHLIAGAPADAAKEEDQAAQERAAADAAWEALWALRGTRSTAGQPVPAVPLSSTGQVDNETWEGETVGPSATAPQSAALQSAAPQSAAPQSAAPQSAALQSAALQSAAPQSAAPQSAAPQSAAPQVVKLQPATSKKGPLPRVKATGRPVAAVSGPFSGQVTRKTEQVEGVLSAASRFWPQSDALQDGAPQPGAPQPAAPQPGAPQPAAPQPGAPQPAAPQPAAPQPGAPQPGTTMPVVTRRPLARRVADKPVRPQVRRKLAPTSLPSALAGIRPQQSPLAGRSSRRAAQREPKIQAMSWSEAVPETALKAVPETPPAVLPETPPAVLPENLPAVPPETPSSAPKAPPMTSGAASTATVTSRPGSLLAALRTGLEKLGISRRETTQPQAARPEAAQSRLHPSEPALARWAGLPRSAVPGRLSLSEPVRPSEASSLSKPGAVVDEKLPVSSGERPVARRTATRTRSLAPAAPVEPHFGAGSAEVRSPLTGPVTGGASAAETSAGRGEDWTGQRRTSSAAAAPTFLQPATPTTTTVWRTIRNRPDLTSLMRPTLVPVSIQREVEATAQPAAAEPQPAGPSPADDQAGDRTRTQTLDLESLSHQVYQIIRRRLAVERERERGR